MDYFKWAAEYYEDAKRIDVAIKRYKDQLPYCKNRENINSKIANLESIKNYLINTGNEISKRGEKYKDNKK